MHQGQHTERERLAASRQTHANHDIPCPDGLQYRPYQKVGIAYAIESKNVLIADEPGLGKTIQAIGLANAINASSILVICPASLRLNWLYEFQKWNTLQHSYHVIETGNQPVLTSASVTIVNYDLIIKERIYDGLVAVDWDIIILDEAHYLKNRKAKRTKIVLGRPDGIVHRAKRIVALTGTPIVNRPAELYPIISTLDPKSWPSFFAFAREFCDAKQRKIGRGKLAWDFTGASNLGRLQERLRSTIMIRRLKKDVLAELPPKVRQVVVLPAETEEIRTLLGEEIEAYAKFEADTERARTDACGALEQDAGAMYKEAVGRLADLRKVAFSHMARLRYQIAIQKLQAGVNRILDALGESRKLIVFAHHHDVIEGVSKALRERGIGYVTLTGETPLVARQRAVALFQSDPSIRVFLGNIQAAGTGLTLTAASRILFLELDWTPANMTQAEDRCHRIGMTDTVFVEHLVFDKSLDVRMVRKLIEKQEILDQALDEQVPDWPEEE